MALKENYKDDILDVSVNTKRKYRMTENADGTVSLEDETVYTQEGDSFGASDMNATNGKVNTLETDIGEINDNLSGFKFYPTGTELVALVSDDSYYTDANGKYVLADSPTGESLIDNVTYKSLASTEDTRGEVGADSATPFSSIKMEKGDVLVAQDTKYNVYNHEIEFKGGQINFFICSRGCTNMQKKVNSQAGGSAIHGWGFKPDGTYERIDNAETNANFDCSAYDFMDLGFTGQNSTNGVKLKLT